MADSLITQAKRDDGKGAARNQNANAGGGGGGWFSCFSCCRSPPPRQDPPPLQIAKPAARPQPPDGEALLGPRHPDDANKSTLVLDLDETLLHSSFKPISNPDFVIPVEIEDQVHHVYVLKRPGVEDFLKRMAELFELVIFTASVSKYADPVLDLLDKHRVIRWRLSREHCSSHKGNYVKDLSRLGRDIRSTIIIDNSPASYIWHVENAVPIGTWFDDMNDTELLDLIPFLEDMTRVEDVRTVISSARENSAFYTNG